MLFSISQIRLDSPNILVMDTRQIIEMLKREDLVVNVQCIQAIQEVEANAQDSKKMSILVSIVVLELH